MPVIIDKNTVRFSAATGPAVLPVDMGGDFVACVAATQSFDISLDGSPRIPFGVGCSLSPKNPDGTPIRFSRIELFPSNGAFVDNVITLIVGNLGYTGPINIAPSSKIRTEGAARVLGVDKVWADGGAGYMQIDGVAGQFKINVRNKDATRDLRVGFGDMLPADLAAIAALTGGFIVGPGENAYFDVSPDPTSNWGGAAPLFIGGAAGQLFTVTYACYKQ